MKSLHRPARLIALAIAVLLLSASCASDSARRLGLSGFARGEAEQLLLAGIGHYEDGSYDTAVTELRASLGLGLTFRSDQVQAWKHLAFIHCSSGRTRPCKDAFRHALALDPGFELSRAEEGHPMWGPVFAAVKAENRSR